MARSKDRDRQREARWRRIVREHGRSGLGVREFCRGGKLTETAFYFWRRELQRRQEEHEQRQAIDAPVVPAFVPVRVEAHAESPGSVPLGWNHGLQDWGGRQHEAGYRL